MLNLLSGLIAIICVFHHQLVYAAFFILLGIFFDFFDGLVARLLKVQGELGKQLDSLADLITSGVAPAFIMFTLLTNATNNENWNTSSIFASGIQNMNLLPFLGLLIALASAYRLAKFNIDERQTNSFIGLPTPAMTLVVLSLPLMLKYNATDFITNLLANKFVLIGLTILLSILMNVEITLFSLKLKNFNIKKNAFVFGFLLVSLILLIVFQFVAIPVIILLYVLLSLIKNGINNEKAV